MGIFGLSRTILRPYNFEVHYAKYVVVPERSKMLPDANIGPG
jgi:hypothetical protein